MSWHDQTHMRKVDLIKCQYWVLHLDVVDLLVSRMLIHILVTVDLKIFLFNLFIVGKLLWVYHTACPLLYLHEDHHLLT